jgi:hypothetical protein
LNSAAVYGVSTTPPITSEKECRIILTWTSDPALPLGLVNSIKYDKDKQILTVENVPKSTIVEGNYLVKVSVKMDYKVFQGGVYFRSDINFDNGIDISVRNPSIQTSLITLDELTSINIT